MAVSFLSCGAVAASTTGQNVSWPNGTYGAGDLGLMLIETANEAIAIPSGWSEVVNSPQGGGTSGVDATATRGTVCWKQAASGAEADVTLADAGDHTIAQILAFRGVHSLATMAINVTAGNNTGTTTTSVATCTAVSTTTDNCYVLGVSFEGIDNSVVRYTNWTGTALSGFTVLTNVAQSTANGGGFSAAGGLLATAGSSSAITMAVVSSILGNLTIAFTPAPPSTGTRPIEAANGSTFLGSSAIVRPYLVQSYG